MSAHRFWFPTASLVAVSLLGLIGSASRPARAGVVTFPTYQGAAHHNAKPAEENEPLSLELTTIAGDQFQDTLSIPETLEIPVSGKFTNAQGSNRTMTFKGQAEGLGGTIKLQNGTGLVSANGNFVVGSFKLSGPGIPELNGGYTFSGSVGIHLTSAPLRSQPGSGAITPLSNVTNLQPFYNGRAHSGTNGDLETVDTTFGITAIKPGGKFTAILGKVPVSGKVTNTGKVTFAGSANTGGGNIVKIKKGVGQLSAQGAFFLGSFQIVGTGSFANESGKYSYESTSLE